MLKGLLSFGSSAEIELQLDDHGPQRQWVKPGDLKSELPVFASDEPIRGSVNVLLGDGKKFDHNGIKIELIGAIEFPSDRSKTYEFTNSLRELVAASGSLSQSKTSFPFDFANVDKHHESYYGRLVRLRYVLRVTVLRSYASNLVHEKDLFVQCIGVAPDINNTIKMEVGIEDCLHIEFEYNKSKYHLKDVVVGKVFFLLVRIKIKHMELSIIRRETIGGGNEKRHENETITKFEIMDGAPAKGESIPVRVFLAPYNLTPTYRNVQNHFSVKYLLNLVLVDEEDRRYFKQQEITLWRKQIG